MGIEVVIKTQAVNIYINISVPLSVGKFVVQCVDWPDSLSVHQVNFHPGDEAGSPSHMQPMLINT